MKVLILAVLLATGITAYAETVQVKYSGSVSLDSFACVDVNERSDVQRVCYDKAEKYMLIRLKSTYYHYCSIDDVTVQGLLNASSRRQFFESRIRGSGSDGPFDCRTQPVPKKYAR